MVGLFSKPSVHFLKVIQKKFSPLTIRISQVHDVRQLKLGKHDAQSYLTKKRKGSDRGAFAYVMLTVPLTCFGLAYWQYNRKKWKETLMHDMELKTLLPPIDLPQDLTNKRKLEYRKVRVKGTFDHSREIYLGPRSYIENSAFAKSDTSFLSPFPKQENNVGYVVVTPFKLSDRDLTILVNRGWIPYSKLDPSTRQEAQVEGEIELVGIVRTQEDKPLVSSDHDIRNRVFKYRDIEEMAELADSSYLFIDAVPETTIPGGPVGGQTQVNLRNEHLQYIITWLSIGTFLGYMWHKRWVRFLH